MNLVEIAQALGGEVSAGQVRAPGPGHSAADRSLSVKLNASGSDFIVFSHAGDDVRECRDFVRNKLGLPPWQPRHRANGGGHYAGLQNVKPRTKPEPAKANGANTKETAQETVVAEFSYHDADGQLTLVVERREYRNADGGFVLSKKGKREKTFRQRRPDPEHEGRWLWNIAGVPALPYRLPDLIEAVATGHQIVVVEGEAKADLLWSWNIPATCSAMGSGKWTAEHSKYLQGADVVILPDADSAGRKHVDKVVASLERVAASIHVLELPGLPDGGDVLDFAEAGGTVEQLHALIASDAKPWIGPRAENTTTVNNDGAASQPDQQKPNQRSLTFTRFGDVKLSTTSRYLVKGILPAVGLAVVWGPPKCGKSFFVFDLVCHVAMNWPYRDRRVTQCPVVYFALEGQLGFEARIDAFRNTHNIPDMPFYLSTDRIVLPHDGEAVVGSIAREFPDVRPGIVVLDTLNRSMAGSENDPADMAAYVRAADLIRERFNCLVIIIHHCGVEGARPRGHTSLTGAADAQIAVRRDANKNVVAVVEFLKDGPEGDEIVSFLEHVIVGTSDDGDAITSCVVVPSEMSAAVKVKISGQARQAFDILRDAIAESDVIPPPEVLARTKGRTILEKTWRQNFYDGTASNDATQTSQQRAFVRAANKLLELKLIGKWGDFVWLT